MTLDTNKQAHKIQIYISPTAGWKRIPSSAPTCSLVSQTNSHVEKSSWYNRKRVLYQYVATPTRSHATALA